MMIDIDRHSLNENEPLRGVDVLFFKLIIVSLIKITLKINYSVSVIFDYLYLTTGTHTHVAYEFVVSSWLNCICCMLSL